MRKFFLFAVVCILLALPVATVYAASPPDGPPGLERAIEVKNQHKDTLLNVQGVASVGVGLDGNNRAAIIILTEATGLSELPASLEGIPVITQACGKFVALKKPENPGKPDKEPPEPPPDPTTYFDRPVPIGVSTGHYQITAGTIGARVTDGTDVYVLSNNHVLANANNALIGDSVLQPGPYDGGGADPLRNDVIGTLSAYKEIMFDGTPNYIDAAIALSSTDLLDKATPSDGYGIPKSTTAGVKFGMYVQKYGRTTGLTTGQVAYLDMTVEVWYDEESMAIFENQIGIVPPTFFDIFSLGGDSGSLIVTAGKGRKGNVPVGLLFAGDGFITIANPIDAVLEEFGVTIDGE
jgi:hypothetical protein